MLLASIVQINPEKFKKSDFHNSKKFYKVTQASVSELVPAIEYELIKKSALQARDIYAAQSGDVIICLMNTRKRLISIVDRFCVVPNTFTILRPQDISSNSLYNLLKMTHLLTQMDSTTKKSITIKEVSQLMLPYDITPEKDAVLNYLSQNWTTKLVERPSFNMILDNVFNNLKHFLDIEIERYISFSEIAKDSRGGIGKRDLPKESILFANAPLQNESVTILLTRKMYSIDDLRIGLIDKHSDDALVNQNILKLTVDTIYFEEIGFTPKHATNWLLSKYISYYLLSAAGKKQLATCLELNNSKAVSTLKVSKLKKIRVPFTPKIKQIVEEIESQTYWYEADKYYSQLEDSSTLFKNFETILTILKNNSATSQSVQTHIYSRQDYALLFAKYLTSHPLYEKCTIGVVLESHIHYELFLRHHGEEWNTDSITFYWPEESIDTDIIIVTRKINTDLHLQNHQKILYLKEA